MLYQGRCHCGEIGYSYTTELAPPDWAVRACQCSFCRAHGVRMTSDPSGSVEFHATEPERMSRYRFGHNTCDFLICNKCGVYIAAVMQSGKERFAVINVNALDSCPTDLQEPQPMFYDKQNAEEKSQRRERLWTPCRL